MHISWCSLRAALAASALLLVPATSVGEGLLIGAGKDGAELEFNIIIPPILRVLENSHPELLEPNANGDWSAQQRLEVVSTMKRGFCVTLRMGAPGVGAWRLRTPQSGTITLDTLQEGYRLCTSRPGRYTLLLHHEFDATTQGSTTGALRWPIQTDFTAL